jgi:hypothetical protein
MSGGLIYSQRVMLALVDAGMDRQDAYKLVQTEAMAAARDPGGPAFVDRMESNELVEASVSPGELAKLFDPWDQLRHIDATFHRLGLLVAEGNAWSSTRCGGEARCGTSSTLVTTSFSLPPIESLRSTSFCPTSLLERDRFSPTLASFGSKLPNIFALIML